MNISYNSLRQPVLAVLATLAPLVAAADVTPATPIALAGEKSLGSTVALSDLDLSLVDQQYQSARRNLSVSGKLLSIGGRVFSRGIGTHAKSLFVVKLDRGARRFQGYAGVDDNTGNSGSVRFTVRGDGRELWSSKILRKGDSPVSIDLDVSSVNCLSLQVDDGGNGNGEDHADWAEPVLIGLTKSPVAIARLPQEDGAVLPGRQWTDTDGNLIQAHGGGIMSYMNRYYWYGENRSKGYVAIGVSGYVSDDLITWKPLGMVLPRTDYDEKHGDQTLCERPKVIYNPTTKQFVMWFHYDRSGYGDSQAGVAVADRPEGPFRYLGQHRPISKSTFRDMNLFVDDDGDAYVLYAGEDNGTLHIVRLNKDWTEEEKPMVEGKTWVRAFPHKSREAPAPFKAGRKYYMITSGCTGWAPNAADLAVADSPLGPWKMLGNPFQGEGADTTFRSQSTCVLPEPGKPAGNFIYMGDRWTPDKLADSRYIWLPFRLNGGRAAIQWKDSWRIGATSGR